MPVRILISVAPRNEGPTMPHIWSQVTISCKSSITSVARNWI